MRKIRKIFMCMLVFFCVGVFISPMSVNAGVKINKKKITLNVGQTYALKTKGTNETVVWSSNSKKIATVSQNGIVTANKKGTCKITAKYKKKKMTCKVTVKQPVTNVSLNKTSVTLKKGKKVTLKAKVTPSKANNKALTWKSSDKKVASVSKKGLVKAKGKGIAKITATAKDGSKKYAECTVYVDVVPTPTPSPEPSNPIVEDPYLITTVEQLFAIDGATGQYRLGCDINAENSGKSIASFKGELDGCGYRILNLKRPLLDSNEGIIKNITFDNCNITGTNTKICAIAVTNRGNITNCIVKGNISLKEGGYAAGTVINNEGTITKCFNYALITVDNGYIDVLGNKLHRVGAAAGICCENSSAGKVDKCSNYADVINNNDSTGGIVRNNHGEINHCINYGNISSKSEKRAVGGIAGTNHRKIYNSLNVGKVEKNGGIAGGNGSASDCIIQHCINVGETKVRIAVSMSNGGYILDCYYLDTVSGLKSTKFSRFWAVSNNDLSNINSYPKLDFTNDWIMGSDYPIPRQ